MGIRGLIGGWLDGGRWAIGIIGSIGLIGECVMAGGVMGGGVMAGCFD